jgi:Tfp pilus assembly protein PilF
LRVADGKPLWAGAFEEKSRDLYRLEDGLAEQVAQALATGLTDADRKLLARSPTRRDDAYQLYLKGRYFWSRRTEIDLAKAIELFQQAVAADPKYALAYSGLADASILNAGYTQSTAEMTGGAKTAAERALAIDPSLGEAHATLGLIAMNYEWDWRKASREYRRAIELNRNYATAHHWYGEFLTLMGDVERGRAELERAQQLDPLSLIISTDLAKNLIWSRLYDRAIEQCRQTLTIDPNFQRANMWLSTAYLMKGMNNEAVAVAEKLRQIDTSRLGIVLLGFVYARAGNHDPALKALTAEFGPRLSAFNMFQIYAGLGKSDEAFVWLEKAWRQRNVGMLDLKGAPFYPDPVRADPRFTAMLERLKLSRLDDL